MVDINQDPRRAGRIHPPPQDHCPFAAAAGRKGRMLRGWGRSRSTTWPREPRRARGTTGGLGHAGPGGGERSGTRGRDQGGRSR